jgi:hypothetical protein
MPEPQITVEQQSIVIERASHCCEYCRCQSKFATQSFSVEHIIPRSRGGETDSLPDPIEAICYHMESRGLSEDDLAPYIGNRPLVHEVLQKKCPLSIEMIRALHHGLGISVQG